MSEKKSLKLKRKANEVAETDERRELIKYIFSNYDIADLEELKTILKDTALSSELNERYYLPSDNTLYTDKRRLGVDFTKNTKPFQKKNFEYIGEQIRTSVKQIRLCTCYGEHICYPCTGDIEIYRYINANYSTELASILLPANGKGSLYTLVHLIIILKNNNYLEIIKNAFYNHKGILYSTMHDRAIELVFEYIQLNDIFPSIFDIIPENVVTRDNLFYKPTESESY